MRHSPFLYAGAVAIYITSISFFLFYVPERLAGREDTVAAPIAMLSLFVLSAAVMGFLFLYRPLTLYLDGQKQEAVKFFGATLLIFACITVFIFVAIFLPPVFL